MEQISAEAALARLGELPGWSLSGSSVRREFVFEGFADAIGFVVRLGFAAEAADHHPDLHINYKRVAVIYTTHSAGGLTNSDFDGATIATRLAESMGGSGRVSR